MVQSQALPVTATARPGRYVLRKLPEVTLAFWIMKIAATTLGETAGDLFAQTLKLGYFLTTIALFLSFVVTLVVQLRSSRYNPFFYWTVILSTSMAGTTMSDFMNRDASAKYLSGGATSLGWGPQGLGLGYPTGAAILDLDPAGRDLRRLEDVTGLTVPASATSTPSAARRCSGRRSSSRTRSAPRWVTSSPTAPGLGYAGGALLITGALAVLVALRYVPVVPNVLLFWIAFVLTRPLGATAGDFLTKPVAKGGLDLGTAGSSAVLLAILLGLMGYAHLRERSRGPRPHAV